MFGRVLGHFTILFWGFETKMNEDDKKEGEHNGMKKLVVDDVDFVVERVFDLWDLILEKFGGFDLFVVYLMNIVVEYRDFLINHRCSFVFWGSKDYFDKDHKLLELKCN